MLALTAASIPQHDGGKSAQPSGAACLVAAKGRMMAGVRPKLESNTNEMRRLTRYLAKLFVTDALILLAVVCFLLWMVNCLRSFDVVTARAVAPLDRLSRWSLPLVRSGGAFLAMKGSSVQAEVESASPAINAGQGLVEGVVELGAGFLDPPVRVVRVVKE